MCAPHLGLYVCPPQAPPAISPPLSSSPGNTSLPAPRSHAGRCCTRSWPILLALQQHGRRERGHPVRAVVAAHRLLRSNAHQKPTHPVADAGEHPISLHPPRVTHCFAPLRRQLPCLHNCAISDLAAACTADASCVAFNSDGEEVQHHVGCEPSFSLTLVSHT